MALDRTCRPSQDHSTPRTASNQRTWPERSLSARAADLLETLDVVVSVRGLDIAQMCNGLVSLTGVVAENIYLGHRDTWTCRVMRQR